MRLPETLRPELSEHLDPGWVQDAEAIVVFGADETVRHFSRLLLPTQRLLAHGNKSSFGLIWFPMDQDVINGAAWDVFVFDQLGCLSPQFYYVVRRFGRVCLPAGNAAGRTLSQDSRGQRARRRGRCRSAKLSRGMEIPRRHGTWPPHLGKPRDAGLGGGP